MDLTAFDLKGKVALVTGGAHGIGFSIAEGMAKCGATVCFNCSNEGSLEKGLAAYKAAGIIKEYETAWNGLLFHISYFVLRSLQKTDSRRMSLFQICFRTFFKQALMLR